MATSLMKQLSFSLFLSALLLLIPSEAFFFSPSSSSTFSRRIYINASRDRAAEEYKMLAPGGGGGGGGAGMLKKGKTSLGKTQNIISTPKKKKSVEIQKRDAEAGMEQYAVMLYGDDSYEMENVINVLCKIIPGYGSSKAMKCFEEAQENGKSVVIVTSKPVAKEIAVKIARNKPLIVTDVEGPLGKDED